MSAVTMPTNKPSAAIAINCTCMAISSENTTKENMLLLLVVLVVDSDESGFCFGSGKSQC